MPSSLRRKAEGLLWELCDPWRRRRNLPSWRYAILCGQARRLACHTPEQLSAWGRSMHSKRGGHAVQRKYREEEQRTGGHELAQSRRIEYLNTCRKRTRELGRKLSPRERGEIFARMSRKDLPR
jgi:hypothetical protein